MTHQRVRQILNEITALETELRGMIDQREQSVLFEIKGKRVQFERSARAAHLKLKQHLLKWLRESDLRSILSIPFIYIMSIPLILMDVSVSLYQAVCFRLYQIERVKRSDYIVIDRHHLAYLNSIEKLNCMYCGYANGLIAYLSEISARTEQYWCPIKHARNVLGSHVRYARFTGYGEAADYHDKLEAFRHALRTPAAPDQQK